MAHWLYVTVTRCHGCGDVDYAEDEIHFEEPDTKTRTSWCRGWFIQDCGVLLMGLSAVIQVGKFETRRVEAHDSEIRIETR